MSFPISHVYSLQQELNPEKHKTLFCTYLTISRFTQFIIWILFLSGLEDNCPHMLLAVIVKQRLKRSSDSDQHDQSED